ncbi:MAG: ankyrin repeat domain-containing protein [Acidobacteria bacterium]|nr:ankyrin repeat domain-containing protein [Acidobacteriota bacterium]
MSAPELPARPSLEFLRKQAKKLARDIAAGNPAAIARAHTQLPHAQCPLSQRDAQLVLAREYGFAGWLDLRKEVARRLGRGLEWAAAEARRIIHNNDLEALRQLLSEHPALLAWTTEEDDGGLLGMAAGSFGDSMDPVNEEHFTRLACAELLLDAGAVVAPSVCEGLIKARALRLIELFHRRGLFPPTLKYLAALGDVQGVRAALAGNAGDQAAVNEAFKYACHLRHTEAAALLLDRAIALDAELGRQIDSGPGRAAFVQYFIENKPEVHTHDPFEPWKDYVRQQVEHAMRDGDRSTFLEILNREPWLLSTANLPFQARWIEVAVLNDRAALLNGLLDLDPAILHAPVPPPSQAIEFAFTYVKTHLLPLLLRIWPMPGDLPHAAGNGDLDRVKRWFDPEGKLALGNLSDHFPANTSRYRGDLRSWFGSSEPGAQRILDTALAWAVLNNHFEVADFLLAHGADINTNWCSHEPASILHELVWHRNYEAMQFLIDRGIDMTIRDFRWNATAEGWARHAAHDERLAQWLSDARQKREQT